MKRFTDLFIELDGTTRTSEKLTALERYFEDAPAADAAWALSMLVGRRLRRLVTTRRLREWAAEESGHPPWLIDECHGAVGDLAETMALLTPGAGSGADVPLHRIIADRLRPMKDLAEDAKREMLVRTWRELDDCQRLVWNKLITGAFRVGVARTLVARALARVAGVDPAIMEHRLMGRWEPTPDDYHRLIRSGDERDPGRPYPFFLASPLDVDPEMLGDPSGWQIEWKWDGIRAQLIRRRGETVVWSRGEEVVTDRFPEVVAMGDRLPDGTVLDGEIVAWRDGRPLPFGLLQIRITRTRVGPKLLAEAPVAFIVHDVLEWRGRDVRAESLEERRRILELAVETGESEQLSMAGAPTDAPSRLILSPIVAVTDWHTLAALRAESSRARAVGGVMLKRRDSSYGVGRKRGDWWKWKVDPYHIDAVLVYAQRGHGRRTSLFTDYTLAVWDDDRLVPVARAHSGLTDVEIREVDRFVRRNTIERHGPVRIVEPELVFEIAFEGLRRSPRHRSGIAMRLPRITRWRRDRPPAEADRLEALIGLLDLAEGGAR